MNSELLRLLLATTLASSAVMVLLYPLRAPLLRTLGAGATHASWACVPIAALAVLLPAREAPAEWGAAGVVMMPMRAANAVAVAARATAWETLALAIWLGGMALTAAWLWRRQRGFVRGLGELRGRGDGLWRAETAYGLPAVIGLFRARIVVPPDFDSRYGARERHLIACHERLHVRRGDLLANAFVSALRCVYWFNPVIHLAARRFRIDQELACDEGVIRRHPDARRTYGEAMLKAQLASGPAPIACHWPAPHPLKERITLLGRTPPSARRRALAALLVTAMAGAAGYGAWAAQPATPAVVPGTPYRVAMNVRLDGATHAFDIRERPGNAFAVSGTTDGGATWQGVFRIEATDGAHARVSGGIEIAGKPVARPVLVVELGKPSGIRIDGGGGAPPLAIELTVTGGSMPAPAPVRDARAVQGTGPRRFDWSKLAPPRYPPSLHEGTVVMRLDVGTDGRVTRVDLERSSGFDDLDQAAMAAARGWYIEPATEAGRAVASTVRVPVEFSLDEPRTGAREENRAREASAPDGSRMARR